MSRIHILENSLVLLLIVDVIIYFFNKEILNLAISIKLLDYLFWFSLGLYLGFKLCKYEVIKVWKEHNKNGNGLN